MNNFKANADTALRRRDVNEDSLTIFYKLYNKIGIQKLDTSMLHI